MTMPILLAGTKQFNAPYTPVAASSGAVAAAVATAALPAAAGQTTWIEGFDVTGLGATGAGSTTITVLGLLGSATPTFVMPVLAGATAPVNAQAGFSKVFPEPLPASAANGSVSVTMASFGSGNTSACVNAYGFQAPSLPPGNP